MDIPTFGFAPGAWETLTVEGPDQSICTVLLNRPERRNAINSQMANELVACLQSLHRAPRLRALIIGGQGTAFSSGGDLQERLEHGPTHSRAQRERTLEAIHLIDTFPCPVIAMVNGAAIAGGLELALGCDIRIASQDAVFALPEVRTAGGFPGAGGPTRLAHLIGRGRTGWLVYSGQKISALEAMNFGLMDQVVSPAELRKVTEALAVQIAGNSPAGVRAAKVLIRQSMNADLDAALALSRALRDPLDEGPDFSEAMAAWRARREPVFKDA